MTRPVVLSYGAGQQTTALLVLIAQGRLSKPDAICFADTGAEHEATYRYLRDVARPYAETHGLEILTLSWEWRRPHERPDLETYCLERRMLPGTWVRWCTHRYKIVALQRWRRATFGKVPVTSWIGISIDEAHRATVSRDPQEGKRYPLIELGLARSDCQRVIQEAGLSVPPKSGCWFCPFQRQARWQQLKREEPELFGRALRLERNARPHRNGTPRYLPMFGSLERIAAQEELPGFDAAMAAEGGCVSGWCFV